MSRKGKTKNTDTSTLLLKDVIDLFISFKQAEGLRERTLQDYFYTFKEFSKYIDFHKQIDEHALKLAVIEFLKSKANKQPATYNRPYSNLHTFFEWCKRNNFLSKNPIKVLGLKKKRDDGKLKHVEEEAIKKLLSVIDVKTYAGLRDYALILLTLDTGIRPKEAFALTFEDIDFERLTVTIRKEYSKTNKERILPISPQTAQTLKALFEVTPKDWDNKVFHTVEGNEMTINRWEKRLSEYSKKIGCKITPYQLRHTFAIMFLRNGGNVFALQYEMGHEDISTTKRYLQLTQQDIRQQHMVASPVNNFVKRTTKVKRLINLIKS